MQAHPRQAARDQGGHALLHGAAGARRQVRPAVRRVELRGDHVHAALRLPAFLRPDGQGDLGEGAQWEVRLPGEGLEARVGRRQGPHRAPAGDAPEGALHSREGTDPRLGGEAGNRPASVRGRGLRRSYARATAPLPRQEQAEAGRAADHRRAPRGRGPRGAPGAVQRPRRQRQRHADRRGDRAGGPEAGRGGPGRPAGADRGRGPRRQRRHRLLRVSGVHAGAEGLPSQGGR
mmetsp:Transcript_17751/g.55957  ORF Transcript_17751/g.55957 Transcript_17751/m.55957 type:complete len:233 (+) Transcript_17751:678-1376(+)